ncbi:MAG: hypothetical protein FD143_3074 [Ignavibacteria bacterium]|nr:MAG: hypothetical protein FD143_3074 [Ignavibacteria bacterium]KAF0154294.1 MAG: hypothetical protein FD188_3276 [Ignavibacteria bacterium]
MKRSKLGNVRLRIAYYFPSGSVLIQTGKDALFRKMALQRPAFRGMIKLMNMYRRGEFVLKMDGEEGEILRRKKIMDSHN